MRTNLPVTPNEYILQDSETIVSKTDLKGKITYVNQDFLRICGFSEEELLGKPHNIVRHPDMPEEAFDDMWRTLKCGKAWTGLVKNRCKNGDYYWVEANVAPLMENHQTVGYTSIRGKPTRDQVKAADDAYRAIKSGNKRLVIREGGAFVRSPLDFLKALKGFSITAKLSMAFGVLFLLSIINAIFAWSMQGGASLNLAGWAISVAIVSVILTVFFGLMLFKSIVAPLKNVSMDIERMTSGDLTGKITAKGEDEIAKVVQSLQVLQINVKLLIGQITQSIDLVNFGAGEIADGVLDLSARTESQASSLQETASAMEELTATVKQNSDNAHQASNMVISTSDIAIKGGEAVFHVVNTMNSIKESSSRIVDIISVIDGIAFQTNILALNAAVEAARAGEQGRGFAVVAAEVRNLAQRSATAAKEIKTLIGDSVKKVDVGSRLVDDAGKTMNEIVESIKRAAAIMGEISTSSREQSAGIGQVHLAITQMDAITQQNASLVEQAAAAAATMKDQADNLSQLVDAFKLMSGGRVSHSQLSGKVTKFTNKSKMKALTSRPNLCLSTESRH
ncbi:MAG: methyl-accepting chemotaxis protein [Burkholderiaceae bacterium]